MLLLDLYYVYWHFTCKTTSVTTCQFSIHASTVTWIKMPFSTLLFPCCLYKPCQCVSSVKKRTYFIVFIFICLVLSGNLNNINRMNEYGSFSFCSYMPSRSRNCHSLAPMGLTIVPCPSPDTNEPLLSVLNFTISPALSYLLLKWFD